MERFVASLSNYIVRTAGQDEEAREVVHYALLWLANTILSTIGLILAGWALGVLWETLAAAVAGAALRSVSGGAHIGTPGTCVLVTTALYTVLAALGTWLASTATIPMIGPALFLLAVGLPTVIRYAPNEHPNRPLSAEEKAKFHKLSILFIIFLALAPILWSARAGVAWSLFLGVSWQLLSITPAGHSVAKAIDWVADAARKEGTP